MTVPELMQLNQREVESLVNIEVLRCRRDLWGELSPDQLRFAGNWSPFFNRNHSFLVLHYLADCVGAGWDCVDSALEAIRGQQDAVVLGAGGELRAALMAWYLHHDDASAVKLAFDDRLPMSVEQDRHCEPKENIDYWTATHVMGWERREGEPIFRDKQTGKMAMSSWTPSCDRNDSHQLVQKAVMQAEKLFGRNQATLLLRRLARRVKPNCLLSAEDECRLALRLVRYAEGRAA